MLSSRLDSCQSCCACSLGAALAFCLLLLLLPLQGLSPGPQLPGNAPARPQALLGTAGTGGSVLVCHCHLLLLLLGLLCQRALGDRVAMMGCHQEFCKPLLLPCVMWLPLLLLLACTVLAGGTVPMPQSLLLLLCISLGSVCCCRWPWWCPSMSVLLLPALHSCCCCCCLQV